MDERTRAGAEPREGSILVVRLVFEKRAGRKVKGEWLYLLFGEQFLLGREEGCEIRVIDDRVSRKHCLIKLEDDGAHLVDLGSTNGTYRNGQLVEEEIILESKDRLNLAKVLTYQVRVCSRQGKLSSIRLVDGNEVYLLARSEILIGNYQEGEDEVDLMIYDPSLKTAHAKIEHLYKNNIISVLEPEYPLKVNGKPAREMELKDGDLIELGETAFRWKIISFT